MPASQKTAGRRNWTIRPSAASIAIAKKTRYIQLRTVRELHPQKYKCENRITSTAWAHGMRGTAASMSAILRSRNMTDSASPEKVPVVTTFRTYHQPAIATVITDVVNAVTQSLRYL